MLSCWTNPAGINDCELAADASTWSAWISIASPLALLSLHRLESLSINKPVTNSPSVSRNAIDSYPLWMVLEGSRIDSTSCSSESLSEAINSAL